MHGKKASASVCNMSLKLLPNISWLFTNDDSMLWRRREKEDENTLSMVEKKSFIWFFYKHTRHAEAKEEKKDEKKEASEREEKDLWEFE